MDQQTIDFNGTPVTMTTTHVTVKPRTLKAKWTIEEQQDLESYYSTFSFKNPEWLWKAWYEIAKRMKWGAGGGWQIEGPWEGDSLEKELTEALAKEITEEFDNELINNLKNQFNHQGS